ncbi:MAG TPA: hypothetical protein VFU86_10760 [Terriglobales bacterium]|nr:hypothetical protein [Terriglobales bacterium]
MKSETESRRELDTEPVLPITIRVELERHGEGETCSKTLELRCHTYWLGNANDLDVYLVEYGRLRIFASCNGVLSVEEV